jgi:sigma-B regulation protein RsbU (phosphoserine phosphatase)
LLRDATDRFLTAVLGRVHRRDDTWVVTLSCAGHPPPLLGRCGREPVAAAPSGTLLGVYPDVVLTDTDVELAPGDNLVLYTDGVTEGRAGDELFGEERLRVAVDGAPRSAASLAHDLCDAVVAFQGGEPRDDIAILSLAVPPE